jgi:hypothetical protein
MTTDPGDMVFGDKPMIHDPVSVLMLARGASPRKIVSAKALLDAKCAN